MIYLLQANAQGGNMSFFIMMAIIFVIMYFFMIRPQNKKRKEIENFQNSITIGTQIVTAGGIYGVVREIDDANNILVVEISKGVCIRIHRSSVFNDAQQQTR